MAVDLNQILSSFIGSGLSLVASIIVAYMYITNENKNKKKTEITEKIERRFIENGIYQIGSALSEYGTGFTYAVFDAHLSLGRCYDINAIDEKQCENELIKIAERPDVKDLVCKEYSLATPAYSSIKRLGMPIYFAFKFTFHFFGFLAADIVSFRVLKDNINRAGKDEVIRSTMALTEIIDRMTQYLSNRLSFLEDYLFDQEYEKYDEFLLKLKTEKYDKFLENFESYIKHVELLSNGMRNSESDMKKITLEFTEWMFKTMDENLLI